jgi:hypothetical protein
MLAAFSDLQCEPLDLQQQAAVSDTAEKLEGLEVKKAAGIRLRSRLKWHKVGDLASKEFYRSAKEQMTAAHITELEDEQGTVWSDQKTLESIYQRYYATLYSATPLNEERKAAEAGALSCIRDKLSFGLKERLTLDISLEELTSALWSMKGGTSPSPDGVVVEFYKKFWPLIGMDFLQMIQIAIREGRFPPSIMKGVLSLLHKGDSRKKLTNWQPITLLNVAYKLFAKVLQLRLQPVLMELISPDQSTFLPLRFILDNLLLTMETMAWVEASHQPLIFLKLDFSNAYDMVDWGFLLKVLAKFGFPAEFVAWTRMLFLDASASVKVNGSTITPFEICRGVRQGCPLAPYLFLVVAEVLNAMVKSEVYRGAILGIKLPMENRQQTLAQYADDTLLTLLGEECSVKTVIRMLESFCLGSGLVLNWTKSAAY